MEKEKNQKVLQTIIILGPEIDILLETKALCKRNNNCLMIGDGANKKPLMFQDIIDKVSNSSFAKMPVIYLYAHGLRTKEGKHELQLDNIDPNSMCNTEDFAHKLRKLVGGPLVLNVHSCFGGSANKVAKALGEGSILVTHIEAKQMASSRLGDDMLHASLKRHFAKNSTPYQQFILDLQEIFETTTFTRVESDGKIIQFKSIRIAKEKEMVDIINKMKEKENLTDFVREFVAKEGTRFQETFPEEDVTEEIKQVSELDNKTANKLIIGNLIHLCRVKQNLNIPVFDSFIKQLSNKGINLDSQDGRGYTPLHHAAMSDNIEIVKILKENGAGLNSQDFFDMTPLYTAATYRHLGIVKLLIEYGADVNIPDDQGVTLLHNAVKYANIELIELLLENKGKLDLDSQKKEGNTLLQDAAKAGHIEIIKLWVENNKKLDLQNMNGNSALWGAAKAGHIEIIRLLGNKVNLDSQDRFDEAALHYAAKAGHIEVVQFLAENKANLDLQDRFGDTALHYAAKAGYIKVVKFLAENKANLDVPNRWSNTALQLAAKAGHTEIVQFLEENNAILDSQDQYGKSPLQVTAKADDIKIVRILKENKEKLNLQDMGDNTALHYAEEDIIFPCNFGIVTCLGAE